MIKAIVYDDATRQRIIVSVVNKIEAMDGTVRRLALRFSEGVPTWEEVVLGCELPITYSLDYDVAHSLADSLAELFKLNEARTTTRDDLLHERHRTDKLTDAIIDTLAVLARGNSTGQVVATGPSPNIIDQLGLREDRY